MPTQLSRADAPEIGVRALKASPVIIATDGREQSDPALIAGRLFAGEDPAALRVMTVVHPMPLISPEIGVPVAPDVDAARRDYQKREVLEQFARVWPDEISPNVEVYQGDTATSIAELAHESGAALIVCGLGRHRVMDRLFGDETALRLVRVAGVPVLATAPGLNRAPRRIVAAIDFSETSLRAARTAIELAAPGATVYLVHVAPRDATAFDWGGVGSSYRDDAGYALEKIRDQLQVPRGMSVQRIMLHGDPATELLAFATSVRADLIASGSHGHGFVARLLIGSVTTRLLRCTTCSVLSVPHRAAMTRVRTVAAPPKVESIERLAWADQLDSFSSRNVGRRGTLEVDDPEIGAQAQENDYPLLGAAFDPYDQRVALMFGEIGQTSRHITRSIGGVSSIDVLKDDRGRDIALRVAHGSGQTLLTFST